MKKLIVLIAIAGIGYYLYKLSSPLLTLQAAFPYLEPGEYLLVFDQDSIKEQKAILPAVVRIQVTQIPELLYSQVGQNQIQRLKIDWSTFSDDKLGSKQELLLKLNGQAVYLSGQEDSEFPVVGKSRLEHGQTVNFKIRNLEVNNRVYNPKFSPLLLSLLEESYELKNQLPVVTKQLEQSQSQLAEFELILANKEAGIAKVKERFTAEQQKLEQLRIEYQDLLKIRAGLDQQKDLSLKVDPYGRLVELSRESLKRETALLKTTWEMRQQNTVVSPEQIVARVEQVEAQLEQERLKIRELREMQEKYAN